MSSCFMVSPDWAKADSDTASRHIPATREEGKEGGFLDGSPCGFGKSLFFVPCFFEGLSDVRFRYQHVNGGYNEQREGGSDDHAADQHNTDAVAGPGAGTFGEHEGEVADDRRSRRHHDRTQASGRGFDHGPDFSAALLL